jgi:hypothetical protein
MLISNLATWSRAHSCHLKPLCIALSPPVDSKEYVNCALMRHSNSLGIHGTRKMGQYDAGLLVGFPGFRIGRTMACFLGDGS